MRAIKVGEIVQDFNLYPRVTIDPQHTKYIKDAIEAGIVMPPLVVCVKSLRLIDGFHRRQAYISLYGADHEVEVVEKKYRDESEMLLDAIRYNANHGQTLSRYDRVHCMLLAERLKLSIDETASALSMSVDRLNELKVDRMATVLGERKHLEPTPIKRSIRHLAGETLTAEQVEVNKKLSGMNQAFHVTQLILLIENDLLDTSNKDLMDRLAHLSKLLRKITKPEKPAA